MIACGFMIFQRLWCACAYYLAHKVQPTPNKCPVKPSDSENDESTRFSCSCLLYRMTSPYLNCFLCWKPIPVTCRVRQRAMLPKWIWDYLGAMDHLHTASMVIISCATVGVCVKKSGHVLSLCINLWRTLFNSNFSVPLSVHFLGASVFSPAAMSFTGLSSSFGPLSLGNGNQKPWHQWALTRFPHPFPQTPEADVCGQYNWCFNTDQHHTKKKVGWFCLIFSPRQVS